MKHLRHIVTVAIILLFGILMVFLDFFVPIPITLSAPEQVRQEVLRVGRTLVGSPYTSGGKGPDSFDCSGLLVHIFQEAGKAHDYLLPFEDATSWELALEHSRAIRVPEPGDILFFNDEKGVVIHAALLLEINEGSYTVLEANSHEGIVTERLVRSDRSDIHSIARMKVISIW
jgi:hypothetical protein